MDRNFNPGQMAVIQHRDGSLGVDACAGTGKTATIVERYARMIEDGADPYRLLLVTFTVKAANEMAERIKSRTGRDFPWATNFHKLCVRLLRYYPELGIPAGFAIVDADDQKAMVRRIARAHDVEVSAQLIRETLAQVERSRLVRLGYMDAGEEILPATRKTLSIMELVRAYEQQLVHENKLDFDKIIHAVLVGLRASPATTTRIASRWTHVTVDESQDTDKAQFELICLLAPHGNICLVGDMDQGIYGFRGAEWANLRNFIESRDAVRIPLETNYRSRAEILAVANAIIAANVDRYPKTMRDALGGGGEVSVLGAADTEQEAAKTVRAIGQAIRSGEVRPDQCAVLYRVSGLSRALEQAFTRARIPYRVVGGLRFWERREVKDTLAYAKVLIGLQDPEAWRRATQNPGIGIGDKGWATVMASGHPERGMHATAKGKARDWLACLEMARARGVDWRSLGDFLEMVGYRNALSKEEDGSDRLSNVDEALNAMNAFPTIQDFLDEAILGLPGKGEEENPACVTLSTIHGAKGLEWARVHVVGCNEGTLPHSWSQGNAAAMEEERRLLYVAATRAKKNLVMSYAARTQREGKWSYAEPSSFLDVLEPLGIPWEKPV